MGTDQTTLFLLVLAVVWVLSSIISAFVAHKNGWNVKKWFLLGLIFGVFTLFFVLIKVDAAAESRKLTKLPLWLKSWWKTFYETIKFDAAAENIGVQMNPVTNRNEVVIVDVNMPFMSIVTIMVKIAIAAIPASIILVFVYFFIFQVLLGLLQVH